MAATDHLSVLVYVVVMLLIWVPYGVRRRRRNERNRATLEDAQRSGLREPPSLHPLIDENACFGCGTCVIACPETNVLGLVGGTSKLINPANCIGHGACKDACPQGAITLVLGTESRGVDIPHLASDFQTNVPGVFIAGELGGMGLIRNAIEQGRQAIESVRCLDGVGRQEVLDVVIVGAGPAGFSASLAARQHGLHFVTLEQETLGGTVAHYPRGKIVMTAPVDLPLYGKVKLRETTKEALLRLWKEVEQKTGVVIRYRERVDEIVRVADGFEVKSSRGSYRTRSVLLAIGRRGTPRKLGVPGEEDPKVVYRLVDPEQYRAQSVLVVGGGDSALEAATSLAAEPETSVLLSYRGNAFTRAKQKNRAKVDSSVAEGRLRLLLGSRVEKITRTHVRLGTESGVEVIENDAVIVSAGGILPTSLLESIGVEFVTKRGTAWQEQRGR